MSKAKSKAAMSDAPSDDDMDPGATPKAWSTDEDVPMHWEEEKGGKRSLEEHVSMERDELDARGQKRSSATRAEELDPRSTEYNEQDEARGQTRSSETRAEELDPRTT